jgi:hypothetical protein
MSRTDTSVLHVQPQSEGNFSDTSVMRDGVTGAGIHFPRSDEHLEQLHCLQRQATRLLHKRTVYWLVSS